MILKTDRVGSGIMSAWFETKDAVQMRRGHRFIASDEGGSSSRAGLIVWHG